MLAAAVAALTYLLALGALYVPAATLTIGPLDTAEGFIRVWSDRGRGFYIGDSVRVRFDQEGKALVSVPDGAARLRIERARDSTNSSPPVLLTLGNARVADPCQWNNGTCDVDLRRHTKRVPLAVHVIVALISIALVFGSAVWVARSGVRAERGATISGISWIPAWALFGALSLAVSRAGDVYRLLIHDVDKPPYWPISVFDPVVPKGFTILLGIALAVIAAAPIVAPRTPGTLSLGTAFASAALLLAGSNLLQGCADALITPTVGKGMYWAEAVNVPTALEFLRTFNDRQLELGVHGRTHPPGAILTYYFLYRVFSQPALVSLAVGFVGFFGTGLLVYRMLRANASVAAATSATALLLFLPAVQVYFVSSLDAVICFSFTATLYASYRWHGIVRDLGTAVTIALSMLLSFAFLWLLATLICFELRTRRELRRLVAPICAPIICVLGLEYLTGFDWCRALRTATLRENPGGFWLVANPGTYFFTRLEGIAELVLFASPPLVYEWVKRLRQETRPSDFVTLSKIGLAVLLSTFLTGAFKTGETARACSFIYPLVVLPLASCAPNRAAFENNRQLLIALVIQTVVMQLFGSYYW